MRKYTGRIGVACGLVALVGLTMGCAKESSPKTIEQTYAEKRKTQIEKSEELYKLAKEVIKKAEFEDGKRGLSLSDSADMAYALGVEEIIREGERLYLFVQHDMSGKPSLHLNIIPARNVIPIDEQKARDYLANGLEK